MEKATVDLTDCKYLLEMHERLKTALHLPSYYGRNWDALWDSLMYDTPVDHVEICGEHTISNALVPSLEKLHEILQNVKEKRESLGWEFDYKIID